LSTSATATSGAAASWHGAPTSKRGMLPAWRLDLCRWPLHSISTSAPPPCPQLHGSVPLLLAALRRERGRPRATLVLEAGVHLCSSSCGGLAPTAPTLPQRPAGAPDGSLSLAPPLQFEVREGEVRQRDRRDWSLPTRWADKVAAEVPHDRACSHLHPLW
jgi:hypothetical protein